MSLALEGACAHMYRSTPCSYIHRIKNKNKSFQKKKEQVEWSLRFIYLLTFVLF